LSELLDRYFFNEKYHHTSCSVIETKYYDNIIEESSIDEQPKVTREDDNNTGQTSNESANSFIANSKETVSSNSCSSYGYTIEDIDGFFASNNGQREDHTLEESFCRPLTGQQNYKSFFL
jgi:hypothetical protein